VVEESGGDRRLTLLVVDDHRIFAEVLAMRLQSEPLVEQVHVCNSVDEARAVARRTQPDVVILDYDIGGVAGDSLIRDLRQLGHSPQVVMLSASEDPSAIIGSLDLGADAWVVKGGNVQVLMLAIQEVVEGRVYLYPSTVGPVVTQLLHEARGARESDFVDQLSVRQLEVLRCLVAGMTRTETAQRLYITSNTVRTHVQHLLHIADVHSTLALVARARDLGVTGIDVPMRRDGSSSG
jgi:DNA-binding NarL/FixJ family response regulator